MNRNDAWDYDNVTYVRIFAWWYFNLKTLKLALVLQVILLTSTDFVYTKKYH
jgi:hypothetical protein